VVVVSNLYVLLVLLSLNAVSIDPPQKKPTKGAQWYALNKSGGIGAGVMMDSKSNAIMINPIPGTPAAAAGIRAGDTLLAVDGVSVSGQSLPVVVNQIRGQPGTKVKLRIRHRGQKKSKEIRIMRRPLALMIPRRPRHFR
jgi:carboxyl-terminal processing protease